MRTTVRSAEALTADMRRIVVTSDEFGDFDPTAFSDSYVKVHLPPPGAGYGPDFDGDEIRATRPRAEWPRTRSITVRAWDPAKLELTLDFVVHHDDGVAGPWAARAQPGDVLHLSGPAARTPPTRLPTGICWSATSACSPPSRSRWSGSRTGSR